ncbi:glycoside hydrolase family 55 protein [Bacillus sp. CECT 9360]|uniref:glycoside hydrolase family 55 protein n=1 Tax=Bacillus sp. CECT 9360 TaxID=2845821 RepID=UPI001E52C60B|nr:glycoside hydrolase family 55 protein [Bacillus sp. CECT 9360]CAH0344254.1 hypothetical protein BCI9360_00497 [Bacillus sp. CECT 9360]
MKIKKAGIIVSMSLLYLFGLSASIHAENSIINVKDYGAIGNGIADDTVAIKKALYYGKNKKVFFPEGTYSIAETLTVKENTEVYGSNSVIKAKSEGYTMLRAKGGNIKIHDLIVDGNHHVLRGLTIMDGTKNITLQSATFRNFGQPSEGALSNSTPVGIRIEGGVENVMINHLFIHNVFAENISSEVGWNHKVARGVLISPALETQPASKDITIQNSSISEIGPKDDGDGIVVQGFTEDVGLRIINNSFHKTYKRAIKIQSPGVLVKDNYIFNSFHYNNFYETYKDNNDYDMWSAISVHADNVSVEKNTIAGIGRFSAAIDIAGGNNLTVIGNSIANGESNISSKSDMIRINKGYDGTSEFSNISIMDNSLMNGRYGVNMVANVSGLKLSGNTFSNLNDQTSSNITK